MAIKAIVNNVEKEIIDVKMISGENELNAWEVRDQQNRLIWGKEGTISGQTPLSFKAGGVPLTGMTLYGNTVQNGTPSPTSMIMPLGVGNWDGINLTYEIPITCGGQTSTIQLSQKQTTRRIKKLVLTGQESWNKSNTSGGPRAFFAMAIADTPIENACICTHFESSPIYTANDYIGITVISNGGVRVRTSDVETLSVSDFKSFLSAQYTAGHPVIIWYVLATPETTIVNEPLMKIGDYADTITMTQAGIEIPTIQGQNTLTVDTVIQPSSITINGHII